VFVTLPLQHVVSAGVKDGAGAGVRLRAAVLDHCTTEGATVSWPRQPCDTGRLEELGRNSMARAQAQGQSIQKGKLKFRVAPGLLGLLTCGDRVRVIP